ncbi:MAG: transcription termination factor Rho [Bifidobacteriaceae bacterium]|jgi:transcription termination factor Rho|nr:transcription termination factor Rho [Bifidobacteriaceae bacterium]
MKNNIKKLSIAELKKIAQELNLEFDPNIKKNDLIILIEESDNNSANTNSNNSDSQKADDSKKSQESKNSKDNSKENSKEKSNNSKEDSKVNSKENSNDSKDDSQNQNHNNGKKVRKRFGKNSSGSENIDDNLEEGQEVEYKAVAGILDTHENYAFLRVNGYLASSDDFFVPVQMVRKLKLRKGDTVVALAPFYTGEGNKTKNNRIPVSKIISINGINAEELDGQQRINFDKLTPIFPDSILRLEKSGEKNTLTTRIIDLFSPIGKGQRGMIVAPPKAGKTIMLQQVANAIKQNNEEVHLMVLLIDERPEEVTDMRQNVKDAEVIASTFDRPASEHITCADLTIERAKRLVEQGEDVVILLDSITRLARAYNTMAPQTGRVMSGGVDSMALYPPKKFFGAARNIQGGGSLTIIATALIETGSKMDEVIFEEFKGTGNMELKLSRTLADKRLYPAIDIIASGTRHEELLMTNEELQIIYSLRQVLSNGEAEDAIKTLREKMKGLKTNSEFLMTISKNLPANHAMQNLNAGEGKRGFEYQ